MILLPVKKDSRAVDLCEALDGVRIRGRDAGRPCVLFALSAHYLCANLWAQLAVVGARTYLLTIHVPSETDANDVLLAVEHWCQHPDETTAAVRCAYALPVGATRSGLGPPVTH